MDPAYQSFIDSVWFEQIFVSNTILHPSAQPSIDLITPGVGMVANAYSFFEPIFSKKSETEIKKQVDSADLGEVVEQSGQGLNENEEDLR